MYSLPYYKEKNKQVLLDFIKQHPFATVIGSANNIPAATQIPLLIEERGAKLVFKGHFMRNTDHHKACEENANVLCLFTGAHSYVSASHYTNPQTASTWNYMSIQARGKMQFKDHKELLTILEETTRLFENNDQSPASYPKLPKEYIEKLATAIIGFEIEVSELDSTFKLSQNRDEPSFQRIIDHLNTGAWNARVIADEMKKRKDSLFYKS